MPNSAASDRLALQLAISAFFTAVYPGNPWSCGPTLTQIQSAGRRPFCFEMWRTDDGEAKCEDVDVDEAAVELACRSA
jgi:hypothetical protein